MTAAEIYAEVATWPEGAKAPLTYGELYGVTHFFHGDRGYDDITPPALAELAFIGKAVKWLLEQGKFITLDNVGGHVHLSISPGMIFVDAPTLLTAVGKTVRSVKQ